MPLSRNCQKAPYQCHPGLREEVFMVALKGLSFSRKGAASPMGISQWINEHRGNQITAELDSTGGP